MNTAQEKAANSFKRDTANHSMKVVSDSGLHRHLSFTNNGSSCYRFDLITWPGYLCITGDCGTYVFRRIQDMFDFFRGDGINPSYWGEKLESTDKCDGYKKYSPEKFEAEIKEWTDNWEFEDDDQKAEVLSQVRGDVLSCGDEKSSAFNAAYCYSSDYGHQFNDFFECDLSEYTFRYLWCLNAIVYGIQEYDKAQVAAA